MGKLLDKISKWHEKKVEENPNFDRNVNIALGIGAAMLGAGAIGYCKGKKAGKSLSYDMGYKAAKDYEYMRGYTDGFPVGFVTGEVTAVSIINKDHKEGDNWILPYPELFDTPEEYFSAQLKPYDDDYDYGINGIYSQGFDAFSLGINPKNVGTNKWEGFDTYFQRLRDGDIKSTMELNQDLIQQKADERIMADATVAIEI